MSGGLPDPAPYSTEGYLRADEAFAADEDLGAKAMTTGDAVLYRGVHHHHHGMTFARREFLGAGALALLTERAFAADSGAIKGAGAVEEIYGLIGEMKAASGKREELIGYLLEGSGQMPGNLAYIVAKDARDADTIWITEVWQTKTDHANSLKLPQVRAAIAKARPILAGFGQSIETVPVGYEPRT